MFEGRGTWSGRILAKENPNECGNGSVVWGTAIRITIKIRIKKVYDEAVRG
jgi:hypothetical protein